MWSWFCVLVCIRAIMFVYDHPVYVQIRAYTNSFVVFFDIDIVCIRTKLFVYKKVYSLTDTNVYRIFKFSKVYQSRIVDTLFYVYNQRVYVHWCAYTNDFIITII